MRTHVSSKLLLLLVVCLTSVVGRAREAAAEGCNSSSCWSDVVEIYSTNGPNMYVDLRNVGSSHTFAPQGCELIGDYFWIDKRHAQNVSEWLAILLAAKAMNREVRVRYVPTYDWYDLDGDGTTADLLCMVTYVVLTDVEGSN